MECCKKVNLGKKWVWRNENLKIAAIGNPSEITNNLVYWIYQYGVSKNIKIATVRRLKVSVKENNRITSEMVQLSNESCTDLEHDLILPEYISECEFSVTPKSNLIFIKKAKNVVH